MTLDLDAVLETALEDPYQALVDAYHHLRTHGVDRTAADTASRRAAAAHDAARDAVIAWLDEGTLPVASAQHGNLPMAVLEALDSHLQAMAPDPEEEPAPIASGGTEYFLHRRPTSLSSSALHQFQGGHLQAWMRHHWVLPCTWQGRPVEIVTSSGRAARALRKRRQAGSLKVQVGSFPDGVKLTWDPSGSFPAVVTGIDDEAKRWDGLERHLELACDEQVHALVLPELTITPELHARTIAWLDAHAEDHVLELVVAGSFHVQDGQQTISRCEVLNRECKAVLTHHKLLPTKHEDVAPGAVLRLLSSPLGLLGAAICLDFCEEDEIVAPPWLELGVEWVLVPAMDDSDLGAYERQAAKLHRAHGTVTVLANQPPPGTKRADDPASVRGLVLSSADGAKPALARADHATHDIPL